MPREPIVHSAEQRAPVLPPAGEPVLGGSAAAAPAVAREPEIAEPEERIAPVLSAVESTEDEAPHDDEPGADGLTEEQREKLAAAGQKKSRSGFLIKVLTIFIIVAGLLLLAQRMLPPPGLEKIFSPGGGEPADVGKVDAKPVPPAAPEKGGHIVGEEPPPQ